MLFRASILRAVETVAKSSAIATSVVLLHAPSAEPEPVAHAQLPYETYVATVVDWNARSTRAIDSCALPGCTIARSRTAFWEVTAGTPIRWKNLSSAVGPNFSPVKVVSYRCGPANARLTDSIGPRLQVYATGVKVRYRNALSGKQTGEAFIPTGSYVCVG